MRVLPRCRWAVRCRMLVLVFLASSVVWLVSAVRGGLVAVRRLRVEYRSVGLRFPVVFLPHRGAIYSRNLGVCSEKGPVPGRGVVSRARLVLRRGESSPSFPRGIMSPANSCECDMIVRLKIDLELYVLGKMVP